MTLENGTGRNGGTGIAAAPAAGPVPGPRRPTGSRQQSHPIVGFDRQELRTILNLYGRKVSAGEWRDYALDALPDCALFSVYRRASEAPLYQIEKRPEDTRKQGAFSVRAVDGRVLRRGHDLARVLAVLEPKRMQVVAD